MLERRNTAGTVTLVDILDRVLDKGLVVAGDIRVSLANVELLTIQVRLLVCSIDKAQEIGLDWWRRDNFLSSQGGQPALPDGKSQEELEARINAIEERLAVVSEQPARRARRRPTTPRRETGEENGG